MAKKPASGGHKLGQLVGDWFEEQVAVALLEEVARELGLYVDHRFKSRECRSGKIIWSDLDDNDVDYDFVLELGGSDVKKGVPLAFFETFWRRGSRHSKDKARDDSGKLLPMRETYPTVRILGIISAGDFTIPAQELVRSRAIDLFYIPKTKIGEAWRTCGVDMEYDDAAAESVKAKIATQVEKKLTPKRKQEIYQALIDVVGKSTFASYVQRIVAGLAAMPIEYQITPIFIGREIIFNSFESAEKYLEAPEMRGLPELAVSLYKYVVVFSDGSLFDRDQLSAEYALKLHLEVGRVASYFEKYHSNKRVD